MRIKSTAAILLTGLILFSTGCQQPVNTPAKRVVDPTLPVIDSNYIRFIPDYKSIALEWKSVKDPDIAGYYIYRTNMNKDGTKMKRVATINNRYANHYLDTDLEQNMNYSYRITTVSHNQKESVESQPIAVKTLEIFDSVSLIEAISNLPRQVKVQWRPHTDSRVASYILEKSTPDTSKWTKIAQIDKRYIVEFIDLELKDNQVNMYRLKSITFDGIESKPSDVVTATTKPLPKNIKTLQSTKDLPRKIQLSWEKSDTPDVVKYNVYRSDRVDGSYTHLGTAPVEHNRFDDIISTDGKIYFYKITTVDVDGLESRLEDIKPMMGSTLDMPMMPQITLAQQQTNKIIVNWIAGDDRAVSYNVFKRKVEGWSSSKEQMIPNIQGLRFEDDDVIRGVEYRYSLQAVDKNGLVSKKTKELSSMLPPLVKTASE